MMMVSIRLQKKIKFWVEISIFYEKIPLVADNSLRRQYLVIGCMCKRNAISGFLICESMQQIHLWS